MQAPLLPSMTTQATSTLMLLLCGLFLVSLRPDMVPFFLTAHPPERSVCKLERQAAPAKRHWGYTSVLNHRNHEMVLYQ